MKTIYILFSTLILLATTLQAQKSKINCFQAMNNFEHESANCKTFYFKGKHETLFKCSLPFLYVTFLDSERVSVLQGYYPFKGMNYEICWCFEVIKKRGMDSYLGFTHNDYMTVSSDEKFGSVEIFNRNNQWICKIQGEERELPLQTYSPTSETELRRKLIYYEAVQSYRPYFMYYNFNWKYSLYNTEYTNYKHLDKNLLNLPFIEFCSIINTQLKNEFESIKNIDHFDKYYNHYLYIKKNEQFSYSKQIDSQKLFNLLKQAVPVDKPQSFEPLCIVAFAHDLNIEKQKTPPEYNLCYLNAHFFSFGGFWYQFNNDISKELEDLLK